MPRVRIENESACIFYTLQTKIIDKFRGTNFYAQLLDKLPVTYYLSRKFRKHEKDQCTQ